MLTLNVEHPDGVSTQFFVGEQMDVSVAVDVAYDDDQFQYEDNFK